MQQRRIKNVRNLPTPPSKMGGLGLLEVMLFVFVVGTLLVVGYAWTMAQQQAVQAEKQASILQQADRFIEAFASANFRLPCPADTPGGVCACGQFGLGWIERTKRHWATALFGESHRSGGCECGEQ
jgi:type II secretory pathway pseudopilin PulG